MEEKERAALLLLARAAEAALHDSERARLTNNGLEFLRARRRAAAFLEALVLRLEGRPLGGGNDRAAA
jgi:hypothetical protein